MPAHLGRCGQRIVQPDPDYHFVYAAGLVVLALTYAGHTWGLGRRRAQLHIVQKNRWLI